MILGIAQELLSAGSPYPRMNAHLWFLNLKCACTSMYRPHRMFLIPTYGSYLNGGRKRYCAIDSRSGVSSGTGS